MYCLRYFCCEKKLDYTSVECRVSSVECRVSSVECRVSSVECRVSSVECRVIVLPVMGVSSTFCK